MSNSEDIVDTSVAVVPKNAREEIRLGLAEFNGYDLVSIRVWFEPQDGGARRPGKSGFMCKVSLLPDIIAGLQAVEAKARDAGLL